LPGYLGLKKQQLFFHKNKPVYLIDNHNKALFSFLEISNTYKKKFNIIHIDAHRDDAEFQKKIPDEINFKNIN
jgi:arginase family enzyme